MKLDRSVLILVSFLCVTVLAAVGVIDGNLAAGILGGGAGGAALTAGRA